MRLGMYPLPLYPCHADRNISLLEICIVLLLPEKQLSGNYRQYTSDYKIQNHSLI